MKKLSVFIFGMLLLLEGFAQVGIGTTAPSSTLDLRGSLALPIRSFYGDTVLGALDHHVLFNGTTQSVLTLPDATLCTGRTYIIKHGAYANPAASVRIQPAVEQTIDGAASLLMDQAGQVFSLMSDGHNWVSFSAFSGATQTSGWSFGGDSVFAEKALGTTSNISLPFITNKLERMRLTANGRLGIGINTPITDVHILSGASASGISNSYIKGITISGNGSYGFGGPGFYLENADNPVSKRLFKINFTANGGTESYINFQSVSDNGSASVSPTILAVTHSGRIGVGSLAFTAINPEKLLVDAGSTASSNLITGKGFINGPLQLTVQNTNGGLAASSVIQVLANNGDPAGNKVMMGITSSGNTNTGLLGGANTAFLVAAANQMAVGNTSPGKDLLFFTEGTDAANERMRVSSKGLLPGADNLYSLGQSTARWSEVWSANGVVQTSDYRLKTKIQAIPYGLKEVMQMRPVVYNWIQRPQQRKVGLIAQEVQQVIPEVVTGDPAKDILGMNYAELVPVLINAIKELKGEVDALKRELERHHIELSAYQQ